MIIPIQTRFWTNRHGNTGSTAPGKLSRFVICLSHSRNTIHNTPETTNMAMTKAESQPCDRPASSTPATSESVASSSNVLPRKSTLFKFVLDMRFLKLFGLSWYGKPRGTTNATIAIAGAAAGTLRRKIHLHVVRMGIAPPRIGPMISEMAYAEEMNVISVG